MLERCLNVFFPFSCVNNNVLKFRFRLQVTWVVDLEEFVPDVLSLCSWTSHIAAMRRLLPAKQAFVEGKKREKALTDLHPTFSCFDMVMDEIWNQACWKHKDPTSLKLTSRQVHRITGNREMSFDKLWYNLAWAPCVHRLGKTLIAYNH